MEPERYDAEVKIVGAWDNDYDKTIRLARSDERPDLRIRVVWNDMRWDPRWDFTAKLLAGDSKEPHDLLVRVVNPDNLPKSFGGKQ